MCSPTILAISSFAIGAAQSISQYNAQRDQAEEARQLQDAQIQANLEQQRQTIDAARGNFANQTALLERRAIQEREAAGQRAFEARISSLREQATARAAAGETAGLSVDALLADFAGAGGRRQQAIDTNLNNQLGQIAAEREGARAQAQSIINSASTPQIKRRIRGPSPLSLGLNIVGAGVGAAGQFRAAQPPRI